MIPVKRANWPIHYLESGGQSAMRRGTLLCEIEIPMGRTVTEKVRERKVTGFTSLFIFRTNRRGLSTPITLGPCGAQWPSYPRQKLNTQNIGENPGILLRLVHGARREGTGRAPSKMSLFLPLESNLSTRQ